MSIQRFRSPDYRVGARDAASPRNVPGGGMRPGHERAFRTRIARHRA